MYEWLWIGAIVVFLILEASTMTLVSVWFAAGSVCALIAKLLGAGFTLQFLTFLAVSVIMLVLLRKIAVKSISGTRTRTNLDRIVGESVLVTEAVDNAANSGGVKIGDIIWRAKSENGEIIAEGERATVTDIDGVRLILKK